jgi:ketosteroid isomerase-like protein
MSQEAALLERYYRAFSTLDAEAMAACYHPQVRFSDPAFPALQGREVGDMWRMMSGRAVGFSLQITEAPSVVQGHGRGACVAHYEFSATGRRVANPISSRFEFRDGLIAVQADHFPFWAWSRQALGLPGLLLGWTPLLQRKVQRQAGQGLAAFRVARAGQAGSRPAAVAGA